MIGRRREGGRLKPVATAARRSAGQRFARATAAGAWADYRRVWSAHTTSTFGDMLTIIALPLAAYLTTESALAVGIVSSMEAVTAVLFGLLAGAFADRLPHRAVLFLTDMVRAVVLGLVAITIAAGDYPVGVLIAAAAVAGAARVLHDAAANAVVPMLVEPPDLLRANGELHASESAANAAGPAIAGGLIALGGPGLAVGLDALTFAVSGAVVGRVRRLDEREAAAGRARLRADIVDGVRALLRDRWMVWALTMGMALNVVAVSVEGQFIPYAKEILGMGGLGIGVYWAIGGTAAVVTALLAGRRQVARGDVIVTGVALFSVGVLVAGVWPSHATAAIAYLFVGVGSALLVTHLISLRQHRFPVAMQGRVSMVMRTGGFLLVAPAHIGGGALASAAGPEVLFVATACVGLAAAAAGVLSGLLRFRSDS